MRGYRAVTIVSLAMGAVLIGLSLRRYNRSRRAVLPEVKTGQMTPAAIDMWTEYLEAIEPGAAKDAVQAWARKHAVTNVRIVKRTRDRLEVAFERRGIGPGLGLPPHAGALTPQARTCAVTFRGTGVWRGAAVHYAITCLCTCKQDVSTKAWHCIDSPRQCSFFFAPIETLPD